MYQTFIVDDWSEVDVYEVLMAMPADGKSKILIAEVSPDVVEITEFSEFASVRVH